MVAITNENKNNLTITNENKPTATTWEEMDIIWDEASGTWAESGTPIVKETKHNITITNESKS